MKVSVAPVAYPHSSDAELRAQMVEAYGKLATLYARAAESAMERQDRFAVCDAVAQEKACHNKIHRIEKGYIRF